ncbi:MAG TPA: hypothetical protein DGS68_02165 [Pseudomonas sp.]|nr:hypothetical protein DBY63_013620 [Pseudomonas sp. RIT 411]HCV75557.1 hypothetical protein [Pseudomonas sp.]
MTGRVDPRGAGQGGGSPSGRTAGPARVSQDTRAIFCLGPVRKVAERRSGEAKKAEEAEFTNGK